MIVVILYISGIAVAAGMFFSVSEKLVCASPLRQCPFFICGEVRMRQTVPLFYIMRHR